MIRIFHSANPPSGRGHGDNEQLSLVTAIRELNYNSMSFSTAAGTFFGNSNVPFFIHHEKASVRNDIGSMGNPEMRGESLIIKVIPDLVKDDGEQIRAFLRTQTAQNMKATYKFDSKANEVVISAKG